MGMTTARILKYMGLLAAFAGIGSRVFSWLQLAQATGSPGGDDITAEELVRLQPILTDAINQGLMSAEIPIMAEVTLTFLGEGEGEDK